MPETGTHIAEPKIIHFGPRRLIGMRYVGKNQNREIPAMWEHDFVPREPEIVKPDGPREFFGVCRCLPGVTDGSFEYIAAAPARDDAPVPDGMVEARLGEGRYVVFRVESLAVLGQAWPATGQWLAEHPEYKTYCGPAGCRCEERPGFEYYPEEFDGNGPLYLYFPVE